MRARKVKDMPRDLGIEMSILVAMGFLANKKQLLL